MHEVYKGYRFYAESSLKGDSTPPEAQTVVAYYTDRAPKELPPPQPIAFVTEENPRFRFAADLSPPAVPNALVSHLSWKKWTDPGTEKLVYTDLHAGTVHAWDKHQNEAQLLGKFDHPAHLEWCDLDEDGRIDLLVSDLGSAEAKDHSLGSVGLLKQQPDGSFTKSVLASQFGRVCEVRAANFSGDDRLDILVAEFGFQKTGGITLLERQGSREGQLQFKRIKLDKRNGAMRLPPLDMNGDGKLDFVALIAQEHEAIDVFENQGNGLFKSYPLTPPREPAFGSNGLEAVDLDQDGDIDFVVTNGDMFDSYSIKPYHQLRWLENQGHQSFVDHHLIFMPGVHGASIGDLDLDGDLDIVTTACFPFRAFSPLTETVKNSTPSAVWLEQTEPGKFQAHSLEFGNPFHACHVLADVDNDGDLDVVAGHFGANPGSNQPPFVVFENRSRMPERTAQ